MWAGSPLGGVGLVPLARAVGSCVPLESNTARWQGVWHLTALEAFARAEAKEIPALAEAINRREEMQCAVDQGRKDVSSRALKRSSKKDNLGNGGKPSTKQNRVYEGRQLVGKRFCSSPSHGDLL
jgi:hypothetical protein